MNPTTPARNSRKRSAGLTVVGSGSVSRGDWDCGCSLISQLPEIASSHSIRYSTGLGNRCDKTGSHPFVMFREPGLTGQGNAVCHGADKRVSRSWTSDPVAYPCALRWSTKKGPCGPFVVTDCQLVDQPPTWIFWNKYSCRESDSNGKYDTISRAVSITAMGRMYFS